MELIIIYYTLIFESHLICVFLLFNVGLYTIFYYQFIYIFYVFLDLKYIILTVNTKTREHGSQSSRKLKMAPVR